MCLEISRAGLILLYTEDFGMYEEGDICFGCFSPLLVACHHCKEQLTCVKYIPGKFCIE